jgi:hypothetical protein
MATKTEIADVLERAADLYESEQVEWCRGTWGASHAVITACASSALGLAAGIRQGHAMMLENVLITGLGVDGLGTVPQERLYLDTRRHVDQALGVRLPTWNDSYTQKIKIEGDPRVQFVNGVFQWNGDAPRIITEQVPVRSKEQVIELFKGLAKDLRNEE